MTYNLLTLKNYFFYKTAKTFSTAVLTSHETLYQIVVYLDFLKLCLKLFRLLFKRFS